jgi:hypothetical protein
MFRKHPEVIEAETRLAELREQEHSATPEKKAELIFMVDAQAKLVDELRWAHKPRPMVTQEAIDAVSLTADDNEPPSERAYW